VIDPQDIKVECIRKHPQGGQHVGADSGVRVTHIPTGLVAECDSERSQHRNKQICLDMILGGLTSPNFR
jgi:protein subunit release factor A